MNNWRIMRSSTRWGSILLVFVILTSIVIQDYTDVLPLGLFNTAGQLYTQLANACLILACASFVILLAEALRGQQWRLAAAVRGGLFILFASELLLGGLDRLFVSRNPQSSLGGPYYEKKTSQGTWVFLKKANAGSPLGFRTDHPYELVPNQRRILFLGDSYTEGSGRSRACNYPTVVESVLRNQLGDVEVMNAGVSGYGPVDALNLLRLLREQGYRFDALVYNLFTENDFTDNLPNTDRRVVGGVIFRVPQSWFLRMFHPLNSYLFRYALVVWRMVTFSAEEQKQVSLESGNCIFSEERHAEIPPVLGQLIRQRLAGSQRVAQSKRAQQEFIDAVAAMKAEADELRIPFVVVVFPDRVIADSDLRLRLNLDATQMAPLNLLHSLVYPALLKRPVIEVVDALRGHSEMYRMEDTHLSDLGNKIAGEYVGERLVGLLATTGVGSRQ
jgi:lysophospholipase L1-like esterase